jgi:hypothetical protein
MPETLPIGPFMINAAILVYIVATAAGFIVMKLILQRTGNAPKPVLDLLLSYILIVVLFWKFGALLLMPSILWERPFQILLITGTWIEISMGAAAALIYTFYRLKKMEISWMILFDLLPFGILTGVAGYSIFFWNYGMPTQMPWGITLSDPDYQYHPINVYTLILSTAIFVWLWRRLNVFGRGKILQDFLIFCGIGLWLISFFKVFPVYSLYLNLEQTIYVGMIALGVVFPYILKRERG